MFFIHIHSGAKKNNFGSSLKYLVAGVVKTQHVWMSAERPRSGGSAKAHLRIAPEPCMLGSNALTSTSGATSPSSVSSDSLMFPSAWETSTPSADAPRCLSPNANKAIGSQKRSRKTPKSPNWEQDSPSAASLSSQGSPGSRSPQGHRVAPTLFAPDAIEGTRERNIAGALYLDKVRYEYALERAEDDLKKAMAQIERQRLEISSLTGRTTAVRLASEEATRNGTSWGIHEVRRFGSLPKGSADFTSAALRELLDQSIAAMTRRLDAALDEARVIRLESERADTDGESNLEQAFAKCAGLTAAAEHSVRQATRAVLVGGQRRTTKLRNVLKLLATEMRSAQTIHVSDMRCLASQLIAQRDAITESLAIELERIECEGTDSVRGLREERAALQAERTELQATVAMRDAEIARLGEALAETQRQLKARRSDSVGSSRAIRILKTELSNVEDRLEAAQREQRSRVRSITTELRTEEREREAEREHLLTQQRSIAAEAVAMADSYEQKLRIMRADAKASMGEMHDRMVAMEEERRESEEEFANRLHTLATHRERERHYLQRKSDKLGQKVLALKATNSRGRSMLYWASMKNRANSDTGDAETAGAAADRVRRSYGLSGTMGKTLFADDTAVEAEFKQMRRGLSEATAMPRL